MGVALRRAPRAEPARQQGKEVGKTQENRNGGESEAGRGPKAAVCGKPPGVTLPLYRWGIEAQVRTETYFRLQSLPDAQLGPAPRLGLELHSQCPELPWTLEGTQPGLGENNCEPLGSQQLPGLTRGLGGNFQPLELSLGCPRSENF